LLCAKCEPENNSAGIQTATQQHLKVNDNNANQKEPTMFKVLAVFAALVVFAPLAYAGLYQAALIVA
jgi:hypothetical protein